MPRSFEENLALLAKLAIKEGVGLMPGQELIVAAEIVAAPLVRLVTAEAYRAGARNVEVLWSDPEVTLARFREGSEEALSGTSKWLYDGITKTLKEGSARLGILSSAPGMLASVPAEKVAVYSKSQSAARKGLSELIASFDFNWSLVGAASPEWAAEVFPDLDIDEAMDKLWDAIFLTSRIYEEDPIAAWVAHSEGLEARVAQLNELQLAAVHFTGPGTDLRVGLVDDHKWAGGRGTAKNGATCSPNIPTEEVFCMPHRTRVDGKVSSTKPLSLRGQLVDGIEMEFKDGFAVGMKAAKGEETLRRLLDTDEGASRLGEVALVPNSSKVSQSNVLFLNSLYDENAACHIAVGAAYGENLTGYDAMSEEERIAAGANDSLIHIDWMIGSGEVDVTGIHKDGSEVPLMRAGEWV